MPFHTSYLYDKSDIELYKTNGYSGTNPDVNNTEKFTQNIDLTVNTGVVVDIIFDGSNDLDDLILNIYRRRDDNWQNVENPIETPTTISNDGTERIFNMAIGKTYGPGHYRIGMKSSGASTTFDIYARARFYRDTRSIT